MMRTKGSDMSRYSWAARYRRVAVSLWAVGSIFAGAAAAVLGSGVTPAAAAPRKPSCDEACLKHFVDLYIDSLASHDPSRLPMSPKVRITEDGAALEAGEGLWVTFQSAGPYRHDFYEPATGGVGAFFSGTENGFPDLISVRLKVTGRKVTEIETIVSRSARNAQNLPPKDPSWMTLFDREEPASSRLTRAQLVKGAIDYMRAIAFQKGELAPFAESCIRLENGGAMSRGPHDTLPVPAMRVPAGGDNNQWLAAVTKTMDEGLGCAKQIDTGVYGFITGYEGARFPVVDVKRQIVFGVFDFMRRGNVTSVAIDGKTYPMMPNAIYPNEMLNAEAWKFVDGKITRIEAVFEGPQAYRLGNGWPGGTAPVSRPPNQ